MKRVGSQLEKAPNSDFPIDSSFFTRYFDKKSAGYVDFGVDFRRFVSDAIFEWAAIRLEQVKVERLSAENLSRTLTKCLRVLEISLFR